MNNTSLVTVRSVIENMVQNEGFHMSYISFMQGYKAGKVDKAIADYILPKKKFTSTGYYIEESQVETFKELLLKRFN